MSTHLFHNVSLNQYIHWTSTCNNDTKYEDMQLNWEKHWLQHLKICCDKYPFQPDSKISPNHCKLQCKLWCSAVDEGSINSDIQKYAVMLFITHILKNISNVFFRLTPAKSSTILTIQQKGRKRHSWLLYYSPKWWST